MDSFYRPTWVEISLDAVRHNFQAFRQGLPEGMKVLAVVKADGYGHGAVQVAKVALDEGVSYLAVAFLDEAVELRRAGITAPILVLGCIPAEALPLAVQYDITVNLYNTELLDALETRGADPAAAEKPVRVHVKLDTGMGRLGMHREKDAILFIERALAVPGVKVEGLFTHFARADEKDKGYTYMQYERFDRIVKHFRNRGVEFPYLHAGNTATGIDFPELSFNMVRFGIGIYGLYPSEEVNLERIELKPAMSLKTKIVMLKTMEEGAGVSYGTIYHASEGERIATLPIGYADGYSRMLTGKGEVLVRGKKVPVVGRICMDQLMISVTEVPDAELGDEVVLFGSQAGTVLPVEDLAAKLGTINYEVVCMLSYRVPRVYIQNGQVVDTVNTLQHHVS